MARVIQIPEELAWSIVLSQKPAANGSLCAFTEEGYQSAKISWLAAAQADYWGTDLSPQYERAPGRRRETRGTCGGDDPTLRRREGEFGHSGRNSAKHLFELNR